MGQGIWILIWDGWGSGLNMINPRLFVNSFGDNWFPVTPEDEGDINLAAIRVMGRNEYNSQFKKIIS